MASGPLALVEDWQVEAAERPLSEQTTAIQLILDLEAAGMITPVSMTITNPDLPYDQAEALALFMGTITRRTAWCLGDFLLFCENVYGHKAAQIASLTGLSVPTLQQRMFVCARIPPPRRVAGLSFSCHSLVARKPPAEQAYWLNEAAKRGWGYEHLRDALKHANRTPEQEPLVTPDPEPEPIEDQSAMTVNVPLLIDSAIKVLETGEEGDEGYVRVPVEQFELLRAAFNGAL